MSRRIATRAPPARVNAQAWPAVKAGSNVRASGIMVNQTYALTILVSSSPDGEQHDRRAALARGLHQGSVIGQERDGGPGR
jgi:hypothetical protein